MSRSFTSVRLNLIPWRYFIFILLPNISFRPLQTIFETFSSSESHVSLLCTDFDSYSMFIRRGGLNLQNELVPLSGHDCWSVPTGSGSRPVSGSNGWSRFEALWCKCAPLVVTPGRLSSAFVLRLSLGGENKSRQDSSHFEVGSVNFAQASRFLQLLHVTKHLISSKEMIVK